MIKNIFRSILLLSIVASSSVAMATTSIEGATTIGSASNSFTPSAKVGISITSLPTSYTATSAHLNGTFQYGTVGGSGTTQDASKIFSAPIPTQSGSIGAPTTTDSATTLPSGVTWN